MAMRKPKTRTRKAVTRRTPTRRAARGGNPWSREEIAFLRKNYRKFETAWVARQLGRTVYSVRYKASDLNIRKAKPTIWRGNTGGNVKPVVRHTTPRASKRRTASKTRFAKTAKRRYAQPAKRRPTTRKATSYRRTTRKATPRWNKR